MKAAINVNIIEKTLGIKIQDLNKDLFEYDNTTPESILYLIFVLINEYGASLSLILNNLEQFTPTNINKIIDQTCLNNEYCNN